jgi:hypothetical protein
MDQPLEYERKFSRRGIGQIWYQIVIVGQFKRNAMSGTKSQKVDSKQNCGSLIIKRNFQLLPFCFGSTFEGRVCGIIFC